MKDITINLSAAESQGEAYWRKRCDVVEAEIKMLRADAALGRAVRNMGYGCGLLKRDDGYAVVNLVKVCNMSGVKSTPEAALRAAGLMEGEGE